MFVKASGFFFACLFICSVVVTPVSAQTTDINGDLAVVGPVENDEGMDWGWIGLLGLVGLIGLKRNGKG